WRRRAYIPRVSYCAAAGERACVVCEVFTTHVLSEGSGGVLSVHSGRHTGLADCLRSVLADWNYGALFFPTDNPAVPRCGVAVVPGDTRSRYRNRSGRRANHGGPLLLYSVDRFVHCDRVRIGGHRENATLCAVAQCGSSQPDSTNSCYPYECADSSLE